MKQIFLCTSLTFTLTCPPVLRSESVQWRIGRIGPVATTLLGVRVHEIVWPLWRQTDTRTRLATSLETVLTSGCRE